MIERSDSTEPLLDRTKKLLTERGDTTLREIADGADVGLEWLKSVAYGRSSDPGVTRLERLYSYLVDLHAAKRFQQRASEMRAN